MTARHKDRSPAHDWARALELTTPIVRNPTRIFPMVIEERADQFGDAAALISDAECVTYRGLMRRMNQYARWTIALDIGKGDCIGLFMRNCPEYVAIWLGISSAGVVVALLNTNLRGASLAHCINAAKPKHIIADAELTPQLLAALPDLATPTTIWAQGGTGPGFQNINDEINAYSGDTLTTSGRGPVSIDDLALYIYTSGTTGLPKAACVSHGRVMQWTHWFAGLMDAQPSDRLYNCLPMYHSVGGVQAPGAILASGGSVVLREKFSARAFWGDIVRWDCTLFQYIGELCRYLLHAQPCPEETRHHLRMTCGNGLGPDIWNTIKERFHIPRILEFYAATEGNVSLFNVEGEPGSIGRVPPYLAHRFAPTLVKFDTEKGKPVRDESGRCVRCAPNETGEMIAELQANPAGRFEGYTDSDASETKILRGVFKPGDAWVRSGDLMRQDERGFFYFVDRSGDTFRWKGENVATAEVSKALCGFPGIREGKVYGVAIPGSDGRAGMATITVDCDLDLPALRAYLLSRLPEYARPLFLRVRDEMELTATFKYSAARLAREGYDPDSTSDPIYFNDPQAEAFVRLDRELYSRLRTGRTCGAAYV